MKYWMIKDGNSEGPFSLEELTAHGLAAEMKVWPRAAAMDRGKTRA